MKFSSNKSLFLISILLLSFFTPILIMQIPIVSAAEVYLPKATLIANMKALCDANPSYASYASVGKTVQNNDIWAFTFGTNTTSKIMFTGAHHGMEGCGTAALYYLTQWLTSGNTTALAILTNVQVKIIPIVNYDNFASGDSVGDARYRKNANGTYPAGTDLNRNYALGWSYSSDPNSAYYSGGSPASQNETKAITALLSSYLPNVYVDIHDFGGTEATHGDIRYAGYGNSSYSSRVNTLHNAYAVKAQSMGLPVFTQMWQGASGFARDGGYNNGFTISTLWEITCAPLEMVGGVIPADYILSDKLPQLQAYLLAYSELVGSTSVIQFFDGFENNNYNLWTSNSTISATLAIGTRNPHHGTYNLQSTVGTDTNQAWASVFAPVTGNPFNIQLYDANWTTLSDGSTESMRCVGIGETSNGAAFNALAYYGVINNGGSQTWFVRAISTGTTFTNYLGNATAVANTDYDIRCDFYRGTSSNGWASLIVDGVCQVNATGLDNDARSANYVTVGLAFSDSGVGGTIFTCDCVYLGTHQAPYETDPLPDTAAPTYSNLLYSTAIVGRSCDFSAKFTDNENLLRCIPSIDNGIGAYSNLTETYLDTNPDFSNFTLTLNNTVGRTINVKWYVEDEAGNWNTTSAISFNTTRLTQSVDYLKWESTKRVESNFTSYLSGSTFNFNGFYTNLYSRFISELDTTTYGSSYVNRTVDYGTPTYTVGDPFTNWVAIADYNCDTLAEVQTAFTNCNSGDIIYIVGHITVTTPPTMAGKSNILIVGNGWNASSLTLADNINLQIMYLSGCTNIVVRDILFNGNRAHNTAEDTTWGIEIYNSVNCTYENVRVVGARRHGVYMTDMTGGYIINSVGDDCGWNNIQFSRSVDSIIVGCYSTIARDVGICLWACNNDIIANSVHEATVRDGLGDFDSAWGIALEVQEAPPYDTYNIIVRQCTSTGNAPDTTGVYGDGFILGDGNAVTDTYNIIFDNNNASYNYHCGLKIGVPTVYSDRNSTVVVINNQLHDNDLAHRDVWYVDDFVTYRDNITTTLQSFILRIFHGIAINEWFSYQGVPIDVWLNINGVPIQ